MKSMPVYCILVVLIAVCVLIQPGRSGVAWREDNGDDPRGAAVQVASEESDEKRAHNIMRFGRGHSIMRFGRAGHNIMHFGKRGDSLSEESSVGYAAAPQAYGAADLQLLPSSEQQQAVLDTLYVSGKRAPQPFVPRLLLPHLFLTNLYNPSSPARLASSAPLSRLSSYNYNKKASDPRDLRDRENVFMHFG